MMSQPHIGIRSRLGLLFRALRHRNYRLFFLGQGISQSGTWMQQVAVLWLADRLSNDVVVVGLLGFVAQVPTFLLAPLAGVWADHLDRRRILLVTQTLAMLQALSLAGLALSDHLTLAPLLVLAAVLGSIYAFDMTASQALVKDLVSERDDLSSAIALNAILLHSARLVGPVLAGWLIVFWGEAACFLVNGISFLPVLAALAALRLEKAPAARQSTHLHGSFADGWSYAWGCRPIRLLLFLVAWLSLLGMPYTLLPAFVRGTLAAEGDALGWLMGAAGLGALAAGWQLGSRPTAPDKGIRGPVETQLRFCCPQPANEGLWADKADRVLDREMRFWGRMCGAGTAGVLDPHIHAGELRCPARQQVPPFLGPATQSLVFRKVW